MKAFYVLGICALAFVIMLIIFSSHSDDYNKTAKDFEAKQLFEMDGCKVYRFLDEEHYHYFTNCKGNTSNAREGSPPTYDKTNDDVSGGK